MKRTPLYISLFIWSCILVLGVISVCWSDDDVYLGSLTLRWPTPVKVLGLKQMPEIRPQTTTTDTLPPASSDTIVRTPTAPPITMSKDTFPTYSSEQALRAFAEALQDADRKPVRVLHYGDSQIEEDRITMILRSKLQTLYGGSGVGLLPLHQTIPTRTLKQQLTMNGSVQTTQQGPIRYIVYGPRAMRRDTNIYGPMGQVALMNDSLRPGSERLTLSLSPMNPKKQGSEQYFSRVRLLATDSILFGKEGDSLTHTRMLHVQDSTQTITLQLAGRGEVYGLSLETPCGVVVDNIPMRGSLGTIFTGIAYEQLSTFYQQTNTRLIIMQYGGNFIAQAKTEQSVYAAVEGLRQQVRYLKRCAPQASLLFIGPSDMLVNHDGELVTNPFVPMMNRSLARMAEAEGIAYWSLYQAMGGAGSMLRWQEKGLAGSDGVHFTLSGARRTGELLWKWLEPQLSIPD